MNKYYVLILLSIRNDQKGNLIDIAGNRVVAADKAISSLPKPNCL